MGALGEAPPRLSLDLVRLEVRRDRVEGALEVLILSVSPCSSSSVEKFFFPDRPGIAAVHALMGPKLNLLADGDFSVLGSFASSVAGAALLSPRFLDKREAGREGDLLEASDFLRRSDGVLRRGVCCSAPSSELEEELSWLTLLLTGGGGRFDAFDGGLESPDERGKTWIECF